MSYYAPPVPPHARRPKRRRRAWALWLMVLVVLAVLLVVGDRAAAKLAGDQLRSEVSAELAARQISYGSLEVGVGGVPFLTQAAAGDLDELTIDMTNLLVPPDATGGGTAVDIRSVRMVARGVQVDTAELFQGGRRATAAEVTGTIVIDYATLDGLVDFSAYRITDAHFSEDAGGLKFSASATALNVSAPIEAVADLAIVDGNLQVSLREVEFVGVGVPSWGRGLLDDLVNATAQARVPPLPYGLALTAVTPTTTGLSITAVGTDIALAG